MKNVQMIASTYMYTTKTISIVRCFALYSRTENLLAFTAHKLSISNHFDAARLVALVLNTAHNIYADIYLHAQRTKYSVDRTGVVEKFTK